MTISNKKRKYIIRNYPDLSVSKLAAELSLRAADVARVLKEEGVDIQEVVPEATGVRLKKVAVNPVGALLLVLLIMIVYTNSMRNSFHYDDIHSLLQNLAVRVDPGQDPHWLSKFIDYYKNPHTFSSRPGVAMPRPLLLTTFGLNYMWTKYEPWSWILVNLLIHIINALLIYMTFSHLTGRPGPSLLAAVFFALHPVGTETVNYINCRSTGLVFMFIVLTTYFWTRSLWEDRKGLLAVSMVCYALGLLTKESAFVIPALLVCLDWLFVFDSSERNRWTRRVAYYIPVVIMSLLYLYYRHNRLGETFEAPSRSVYQNLLTQSRALIHYINLLIIPIHLNISYELDIYRTPGQGGVWAALLGLGGLVALAFYLRKKVPVVSFAVFYYFIILSPTSSVIPLNAIMNEHRIYEPSAMYSLLLALGIYWLIEHVPAGFSPARWSKIILSISFCILAFYVSLLVNRNFTWETDFTVWWDSAKKAPLKAQVVCDLGNAFYRAAGNVQRDFQADHKIDKQEQAEIDKVFRVEVPVGAIGPKESELLNKLSIRGVDRAEQLYLWGIRVEDSYFKAYHNIGTIWYTRAMQALTKKNKEEAVKCLKSATKWFNAAVNLLENGESYNDYASTYMQLANMAEDDEQRAEYYRKAEENYRRAVSMDDELYKARTNLALVITYQQDKSRAPEALRWCQESYKIYPFDSFNLFTMATILRDLGRIPEAMKYVEECLKVDPQETKCKKLKAELQRNTSAPFFNPGAQPAPPP